MSPRRLISIAVAGLIASSKAVERAHAVAKGGWLWSRMARHLPPVQLEFLAGAVENDGIRQQPAAPTRGFANCGSPMAPGIARD